MKKIKIEITSTPELKTILRQINNGADINVKDNYGYTALIIAAAEGNLGLCKLLIKNGADVNIQNDYGWTALIDASQGVYPDICKLLIENNADINIKDDLGNTAIDYMQEYGTYKEIAPYKIIGSKYFKEVFKDVAEDYMDIFETTLYSQELDLDDIKANIEMFYSNVVARMADNTINESVEL